MAIQTFNPPISPSPGTTVKPKLKLFKAEFGDGYTQTTRAGLNHKRKTITLTWEILTPTQAGQIVSFFEAMGGDTPFYYTPSDESTPIKWTCEEWDDQRIKGGLRKVTATFEQCFNLMTHMTHRTGEPLRRTINGVLCERVTLDGAFAEIDGQPLYMEI